MSLRYVMWSYPTGSWICDLDIRQMRKPWYYLNFTNEKTKAHKKRLVLVQNSFYYSVPVDGGLIPHLKKRNTFTVQDFSLKKTHLRSLPHRSAQKYI